MKSTRSTASSHRGVDEDKLTPLCLNDGPAILTNLVYLYMDNETADTKLVVAETVLPAHKTILMASSPYFRKMFLGEWKESGTAGGEITLHDVPECQTVFPRFLSFMYCGFIKLTADDVLYILILADKYAVSTLEKLCIRYMCGLLQGGDLEMALKWLPFADLFSLDKLRESCVYLIARNLEAAALLPSWMNLTILQLLLVLESNVVLVKDEFTLFKLLEKRLIAEGADTCAASTKLVATRISFESMSTMELTLVEQSMLVNVAGNEALEMHLMKAFRYKALAAVDGFNNVYKEHSCDRGRWYEDELSHNAMFAISKTNNADKEQAGGWKEKEDELSHSATIHIATSSTGRGLSHPSQKWMFRVRSYGPSTPHRLSGEIVATHTNTTTLAQQSRQEKYQLLAKFAVRNREGIVYWTFEISLDECVIPRISGGVMAAVTWPCDNKTLAPCTCRIEPQSVTYSVKLTKL